MFFNHNPWIVPNSTVPKFTLLLSVSSQIHSVSHAHTDLLVLAAMDWWVRQFLAICRIFWCLWLEVLSCVAVYTTILWLNVVNLCLRYFTTVAFLQIFLEGLYTWQFVLQLAGFHKLCSHFFQRWVLPTQDLLLAKQHLPCRALWAFFPWSISIGLFWFWLSGVLQ